MNIRKYLTCTFMVAQFACFTQTYIGPVVGYDLTKMQHPDPNPLEFFFAISDIGFAQKSNFYGIRLQQSLFSGLGICVDLNYTQKKANGTSRGIFPLSDFQYVYYRSKFSLYYRPLKWFYIGLGGNYNSIEHIKYTFQDYVLGEGRDALQDYGITSTAGLTWKNIELEFYYYKGMKSNNGLSNLYLLPIHSKGLSLSYKFKILGKPKKKRAGKEEKCPKF